MSYCRFSDDSDVYVIQSRSIAGDPLWIIYTGNGSTEHRSEQETIDALLAIRARGSTVPDRALKRLAEEMEARKR